MGLVWEESWERKVNECLPPLWVLHWYKSGVAPVNWATGGKLGPQGQKDRLKLYVQDTVLERTKSRSEKSKIKVQ